MDSVTLTVLDGPSSDESVTSQRGDGLTIGRSDSCDLSIIDMRMSRCHFIVKARHGDWTISDHDTANGTRVNGVQVIGETKIANGDVVHAGDTRFRISTQSRISDSDSQADNIADVIQTQPSANESSPS